MQEKFPTSFTVLDQGEMAPGAKNRKNYAIYNQEELDSFWKLSHADDTKKAPKIDFDKKYVVVVFAGTKPSTGYAIKIGHILESGNVRNVDVVIIEPAQDCQNAQTTTSPYQFVEVPYGNDASLSHNDVEKKIGCNP